MLRGIYFVCSLFCYVNENYVKSFALKFLKWVYLNNHSSESIHTWVMVTLAGLLTFHEFWPQGPCPRMGLEVKI